MHLNLLFSNPNIKKKISKLANVAVDSFYKLIFGVELDPKITF